MPDPSAAAHQPGATARPAAPDPVVLGYVWPLAERLERASSSRLRAVYLHGSAVLGGWTAGSDIDLLVVVLDDVTGTALGDMALELMTSALDSPGRRGLECSIVSEWQVREPAPPWPFLLHVSADPASDGPSVAIGEPGSGDADLLMHYAVCRAAGWAVTGPPPAELIGDVPRPLILDYLADELGWGLANAPEAYPVLNACRALIYLTDGSIVSKLAGGISALNRGLGPADVIMRAIRQQRGDIGPRPADAEAIGFVESAAARLRSAASLAG